MREEKEEKLSHYLLFTAEDVEKYIEQEGFENIEKEKWSVLSHNDAFLDENVLDKYKDNLDWFSFALIHPLDDRFLKKYSQYISWNCISLLRNIDKDFIKKYKDKLPIVGLFSNPYIIKLDIYEEIKKEYEEYEKNKKKNTKEEISKEPVKRTRLTEKKIMEMKKSELKEELNKRKIKYLYKNTLPELQQMLINSIRK